MGLEEVRRGRFYECFGVGDILRDSPRWKATITYDRWLASPVQNAVPPRFNNRASRTECVKRAVSPVLSSKGPENLVVARRECPVLLGRSSDDGKR